MQGLFYLTQQQLSGFAVAFPPDSICNSDRLWLLHVVTKHRDPGCGNRQELGTGQSSDLLPPMPRDTKKGWPAFTEELPPTTRQQEHFSQDTSQKINGSTIINWALGSTPTKIVCLAKSRLFHAFLSWKCIKRILNIHWRQDPPSVLPSLCSGRGFAEAVCTAGLCMSQLPLIYPRFAAHSVATKKHQAISKKWETLK